MNVIKENLKCFECGAPVNERMNNSNVSSEFIVCSSCGEKMTFVYDTETGYKYYWFELIPCKEKIINDLK